MDRYTNNARSILPCLALGLMALTVNAQAHEVWLCSGATTLTMPDTGEVVSMWGFAEDDNNDLSDGCGSAPQVPGPRITVPPGDTSLTIHLANELPEPVSVVIPGQVTTMTPVRNSDGRVRSFTHETTPGGQQDYSWTNLSTGTFVYHSGTHPAVQVQMGLYGAVTADSGPSEIYDGAMFDNEVLLFYSEIDPILHAAVVTGNYGPGSIMTSTIDYQPRYFLVNGTPFSSATPPIAAGVAGETTLLRFFNMGLKTHVPVLQGMYMSVIAEDGKSYPFAREQYSVMLAAGSTKDALITPATTGTYPLYDRVLALTNGPNATGGLMSFLDFSATTTPALDTVTILRASYVAGTMSVLATTTDPAATLSFADPNGGPDIAMTTYTPDGGALNGGYYSASVSGVVANPGSVTVNSSSGGADIGVVPSTEPPVANVDVYATDEDTLLAVAATGVLGNDLDGGWLLVGEGLQAAITTQPAHGTVTLAPDGSMSYIPNANYNGSDSFTYVASAVDTASGTVLDSSGPTTVDITVAAVNDLPVAQNDAYAMDQNSTLSIAAAGVLANDSDVDSDPFTAVLVAGPGNGTLSLHLPGQ
jgi:VCBS repeat-containing protein